MEMEMEVKEIKEFEGDKDVNCKGKVLFVSGFQYRQISVENQSNEIKPCAGSTITRTNPIDSKK